MSLEVKWIETPVRKAISALKTRKPTHRLIFNEVAKLLVGRRQPRPQGLLAFQYGGGRRKDPGTQQKSRD